MFLVKNILFKRRYSLARLQYIDVRVELLQSSWFERLHLYVKIFLFYLEFLKGLEISLQFSFFLGRQLVCAQTDLFSNRSVSKKYGNYSFLC